MPIIYHLTQKAAWEEARLAQEYRAVSLAEEGFIHCSQDEPQLLRVANRLFSGHTDLLVLDVETSRLASPLKREASRSGEIYPHIYGPLNTSAVLRVRSLPPDSNGKFTAIGG